MSANTPTLLGEDDYEAIEAAVMETSRGRWFLAEYAKRHRSADTRVVLDAIGRLEGLVGRAAEAPQARMRFDLMDMSAAIERTRRDLAQLKSETEATGRFVAAGEELDAVVTATESATQEILGAAERIQEAAWSLKDAGADQALCDTIDQRATDIYLACSFQDLTGQRIAKVVQTLRYLDGRINALLDMLGGGEATATPQPAAVAPDTPRKADAHLLNGPALPGRGLDQANVDAMIEEELFADAPREAPPRPAPAVIEAQRIEPTPKAAAPEPVPPPRAMAAPEPPEPPAPKPQRRLTPLLPDLADLSFEEKMALFS